MSFHSASREKSRPMIVKPCRGIFAEIRCDRSNRVPRVPIRQQIDITSPVQGRFEPNWCRSLKKWIDNSQTFTTYTTQASGLSDCACRHAQWGGSLPIAADGSSHVICLHEAGRRIDGDHLAFRAQMQLLTTEPLQIVEHHNLSPLKCFWFPDYFPGACSRILLVAVRRV